MRDLAILLIVVGSIPVIFYRPYVGILVWSWLGYMNPHRLAWGFAYDFPFAQLIAIVTIAAIFFSKEKKRVPLTGLTIAWLAFVVWMNLTTLFALNPERAIAEWDRTMKIQLVSVLTVMLMTSAYRVKLLVWTIVGSLGFFGIKGGIFAIATGGNYLVWGPPGSFIEGNNELALALIMLMPLMWYLFMSSGSKMLKWGSLGALGLCFLSVLTSHSRGALLAMMAMLGYLVLKSSRKGWLILCMLLALPIGFSMMPDHWYERMSTISEYDQDESAMGRINAWWFAYNLAKDRPLIGGGYNTFTEGLFAKYAPVAEDFHDAHSIYFEVLGEHGFVGLFLFLLLGSMTMLHCRWVIKQSKRLPDFRWAADLASMLQVSLVGYAVGGLFLGLAYFDLYYHLIAITVILRQLVHNELLASVGPTRAHSTFARPATSYARNGPI